MRESAVRFVLSEMLIDFEHSLDQDPKGYEPIEDVEPHIRYTHKRVSSFKVRLKDGTVVEVTGKVVKRGKPKKAKP